jgi:murein DD-endopeptidase MepM/ murein hydrolase activator NlpD
MLNLNGISKSLLELFMCGFLSMRPRVAFFEGRPVGRLILVSLTALLASACSGDTLRFSENPFSNPFASSAQVDPAPTGSVPGKQVAAVTPPGSVAQPAAASALPPPSVPGTGNPSAKPILGATTGAAKGWTAAGGTQITPGAGDTVEALSGRYGVPVAALREVNGIAPGGQPTPGKSFVIPVLKPNGGSEVAQGKAPPKAAPAKPAPQKTAEKPKTPPAKADTRGLDKALVKVDESKPAAKKVADEKNSKRPPAPKQEPKKVAAAAKPTVKADDDDGDARKAKPGSKPEPKKVGELPAKPEPKKVAALPAKTKVDAAEQPAAKAAPFVAKAPPASVSDDADPTPTGTVSKPEAVGKFRWPAKGRVISGFGSAGNEGINISVPEGTPVHAAEDGVVAYAGDELKRYGKLVLVRHSDGWVTAYAHNGELSVKKGDKVRRGQPIAKAGQTGNVASPQVHFELRKGATPVDPTQHLAGN